MKGAALTAPALRLWPAAHPQKPPDYSHEKDYKPRRGCIFGIAMMSRRLKGTWIAPGVRSNWTPEILRASLLKVANVPHKVVTGAKSGLQMQLFLPGRRFKRITLGDLKTGIAPREGRGFTLEVGGIMGAAGTMDLVKYVNRSREPCFAIFLDVPEGEFRVQRFADLLHAAEEVAKKSGVEYLNLDTPCEKGGNVFKVIDRALEQACNRSGWSKFHDERRKDGTPWARFGIYLARHKKKPKAPKGNGA